MQRNAPCRVALRFLGLSKTTFDHFFFRFQLENAKEDFIALLALLPDDVDSSVAQFINGLRMADFHLKSLITAGRLYIGNKKGVFKDEMNNISEEVKCSTFEMLPFKLGSIFHVLF